MTSTTARATSGTIYNLQALRAIAALLVVFVHLEPLAALLHIPELGGAGVDIFFVISGYCIANSAGLTAVLLTLGLMDLPVMTLRQLREVNAASKKFHGIAGKFQGLGSWTEAWIEH